MWSFCAEDNGQWPHGLHGSWLLVVEENKKDCSSCVAETTGSAPELWGKKIRGVVSVSGGQAGSCSWSEVVQDSLWKRGAALVGSQEPSAT